MPYDEHFSRATDLAYDKRGRLVSLTNPLRRTHRFTYDGESQLTGYTTPMNRHYAYAYDGSGRVTGVTLPSETSITNAYVNSRLSSVTAPDGVVTFAYDPQGRLAGVSGNDESLSFTYQGDLPVSVTQSGDTSVPHTTVIAYNDFFEPVSLSYAGAEEVLDYDWDGLLLASGDIDILRSETSGRTESVTDGADRLPVRMTQGSDRYYFAYDQVGSLRGVFDAAGTLVREIRYDAYGNILSETTAPGYEALCVPLGFAGGLHDRDTSLVLFGFHDYQPKTGRWTTPDPIGFAGGHVDLYGYCGGDPVNWVDADGLMVDIISAFGEGALDGALQLIDIPYGYLGEYYCGLESLATQGYHDPNLPGMRAGRTAGTIGLLAGTAAIAGSSLHPLTAAKQEVVRWGGPIMRDSWVMTGKASLRNALMAGRPLRFFSQRPATAILSKYALKYPPGIIGKIKGILGQRIVSGGVLFAKIAI